MIVSDLFLSHSESNCQIGSFWTCKFLHLCKFLIWVAVTVVFVFVTAVAEAPVCIFDGVAAVADVAGVALLLFVLDAVGFFGFMTVAVLLMVSLYSVQIRCRRGSSRY